MADPGYAGAPRTSGAAVASLTLGFVALRPTAAADFVRGLGDFLSNLV